jgi:hypothetical protein
MGDSRKKDMDTVSMGTVSGNPLFERAVTAIGLDGNTTRWLLVSVLSTVGCAPDALTPDELGHLLPEVDRRLRLLIKEPEADAAMKRLYNVMFDQAGPA